MTSATLTTVTQRGRFPKRAPAREHRRGARVFPRTQALLLCGLLLALFAPTPNAARESYQSTALQLLHPACAKAQSTDAAPTHPTSPLEEDAFADDPIGTGAADQELQALAPLQPTEVPGPDLSFGPRPRTGRATQGQVLQAAPSVEETEHQLHVTLDHGLALWTVKLQLNQRVSSPAEAQLRWPVPAGARPVSLEVCNGSRCRHGLPHRNADWPGAYDAALLARGPTPASGKENAAPPIAELRIESGAQGRTELLLHAAPVVKGQPLELTLQYLSAAPIVGGRVRLHVPARGMDPRIADTALRVESASLKELQINDRAVDAGQTYFKPWIDAWITADSPSEAQRSALRFPCAATHPQREKRQCFRLWASAPLGPPQPQHLILAVDASPSMQGPARSRLLHTVRTLLARAPTGTTIQALAFAARKQVLVAHSTATTDISLNRFQPLLFDMELGSTTRLGPLIDQALAWKRQQAGAKTTALVIIGDGSYTRDPESTRALKRAQNAGLVLYPIVLVDEQDGRPAHDDTLALARAAIRTGGTLLQLAAAARVQERHGRDEPLSDRLAAVFAGRASILPVRAPGGSHGLDPDGKLRLRAGEQREVSGVLPRTHFVPRLAGEGARAVSASSPVLRALQTAGLPGSTEAPLFLTAIARRDLMRTNDDFPDAPRYLPAHGRGARRCDRRGPAYRESGINQDAQPVLLAHPRACAPQPDPSEKGLTPGQGMPEGPLLTMLRQRIIPTARGCFRRDRAGRLDYEVRAVYRFEMAHREVISVAVEGEIPERLRTCLLDAVDGLLVPFFVGTVRVQYPLRTQREPLPMEIELDPKTERQLRELGF